MLLSRIARGPLRSIPRPLHRTLFSLPNLPSIPNFLSQSQTFNEKRLFPYNAKELYAVVADVASYPQFIPFCTGSRIDDGALKKAMIGKTVVDAELTVGFMSFKESYVSTVTCVPFKSVQVCILHLSAVASSTTPLFNALSTTWRFHSASPPQPSSEPTSEAADLPGPTWVTFDLTYEFANPLHAGLSATFFGNVSGLMIQAFEDRCRTVYGPRS
ncbi:hypothetical protein HYPSUDRAFT_125978 [Hypholoma sublateritium FD-334 SS-4]|uniref:Coenzyme Q-binding protein COQ10 START domain-containing protein n=1 Tax=Hypholoma sublateritium (strain FD-334 SS-4) TaxID=945553 RepID=A0A0D2PPD6_HYPSF|nr:hypothetical protein HYPSUDRAFT_125978 [Hypholoma sublateritium FD-334 SS-4]